MEAPFSLPEVTPRDLPNWHGGALPGRDQQRLEAWVQEFGGLLFRGFDVGDAHAFDRFIGAFGLANFPYSESFSNALRFNRTERVFTANEAPASVEIFLHHEMAQTLVFPKRLFFFGETTAERGGETPLCRSDLTLRALEAAHPTFVQALREKGVRYRSTLPSDPDPASGQGRSWRATLRVDTPNAAEATLQALGYRWRWAKDHALTLQTPPLPAVLAFDQGPEVFFNQLLAAHAGWRRTEDEHWPLLAFGDQTPLPTTCLDDALAIAEDNTLNHAWRTGDIVFLDNTRMMHGRRPFEGSRSVLAALCEPQRRSAFKPA